MEDKCLITSANRDGCVMRYETAIIFVAGGVLMVALATLLALRPK